MYPIPLPAECDFIPGKGRNTSRSHWSLIREVSFGVVLVIAAFPVGPATTQAGRPRS